MINTLLIAYALTSLMLGALQLLNRNAIVCRSLSSIFLILQVGIAMFVSKFLGTSTGGYFTFDGLGVLFTLVLTIVALAAFCHSRRYIIEGEIAEDDVARAQYYGAMTILTMALTMATLSNHIAMTWIFVELTTLSASALIFYRRNAGSIEATWKYVFACSISLVLVYVGILLVTISMGPAAEDGLTFDVLMQAAPRLDTFWLKMAFVFIFVGYTAKMSLVPMFTAGIDAKDKAPTPASAMLSTVVMNVGFVGFYRVYAVVAHTSAARWAQMVVLLTGLVSIFVAAVYLVRVKNVKRLFAYSSVEHAGVAMLGVAAGGVGLFAAVLHLVLHSFAKAAIFMHIGQLYRVFATKQLSRMGHYIRYSGTGATLVIIALLCVTAMPPSGLFVTELLVFKSLVDMRWWAALAFAMLFLCVIVWAIGRDMFSLLFLSAADTEVRRPQPTPQPLVEAVFQFILLMLAIWWGLLTPQFISQLVNQASELVSL